MQQLFWGILARSCGSTDQVQWSLYKNNQGPIFLNQLKQARLLSSLVHGNQTKHVSFEYASFHNQNTWLMTIPVETVHMTNYGLSKNPSEHLDLPQEYLDI